MPFLNQPSRTKKSAPPISPARTQGNQKRTKTNEPSGANRTVSVDKNKQTEPVATIPPEPSGNDTTTQHGSSWSAVKSKSTASKEDKTKKAKVSAKSLFESDSDSEDEDRDQAFAIPEQNSVYILSPDYSVSSHFSVTFEIDTTLEPDKFLESTILKVNTVLKQLTTEGQLAGYSGRAIIIPWEDTDVYSNRAFRKIPKSIEHNWNDKGHADCLEELNSMIRSFLPSSIKIAGLKKVTFATGQNFRRGDPAMLSLECEKN